MEYNIALLKGDGIGPEIIEQAILVLNKIADIYGHDFICILCKRFIVQAGIKDVYLKKDDKQVIKIGFMIYNYYLATDIQLVLTYNFTLQ